MKLFKKKKETTQQWLAKKHTYNHSYYKNRKLWLIDKTCHPDEKNSKQKENMVHFCVIQYYGVYQL